MANNSTTPKSLQMQKEPQNFQKGFYKLLMCPYYESLLVLYANFTSLSKQLGSFKKSCFLEENGPDIVCMSISNGFDSFPNLETKKYQYQTFETDIPNNNVAIYIKSNISCKKREDLMQFKFTSCTHFWVNLLNSKNREIVLGIVFWHSLIMEESKNNLLTSFLIFLKN